MAAGQEHGGTSGQLSDGSSGQFTSQMQLLPEVVGEVKVDGESTTDQSSLSVHPPPPPTAKIAAASAEDDPNIRGTERTLFLKTLKHKLLRIFTSP